MKLTERIYLCGSGAFGLTPEGDCHCYVLDGGSELALIDCGLAANPQAILLQMERDGLDIKKLNYVLLTHAHPDHSNGCAWLKEHLGIQVIASEFEAQILEKGILETLEIHKEDGNYQQFADMVRCKADRVIKDQETILVGDLLVTALLTPGHTKGSASYEVEIRGLRDRKSVV